MKALFYTIFIPHDPVHITSTRLKEIYLPELKLFINSHFAFEGTDEAAIRKRLAAAEHEALTVEFSYAQVRAMESYYFKCEELKTTKRKMLDLLPQLNEE